MQQKKSFLEKLTGTVNVENEIYNDIATEQEARAWEENESPRSRKTGGNMPKPTSLRSRNERYEDEGEQQEEDENPYDSAPDEDEPEEDQVGQLAIDMYESDNELIIQSMIAGVTPDHLNINITRDTVSIQGKRVAPQGIADDQYIERELFWGEFSRTIDLPFEINTDGAEAVEKYGLLIIRLPKVDTNKSAELKVKSI